MIVSAKTEYACVAMADLAARHDSIEPVRIREIAARHGIPSRFLVQILLQLKSAGLVTSKRGAAGGYHLARDPREVSLGDIITVVDGRPGEGPAAAESPVAVALAEVWQEAGEAEKRVLDAVSLAELLERSQRAAEQMYYI